MSEKKRCNARFLFYKFRLEREEYDNQYIMTIKRSMHAGMTDYGSATIDELSLFAKSWSESINTTILELTKNREKLLSCTENIGYRDNVILFIDSRVLDFRIVDDELNRLIVEFNTQITDSHVKSLEQLCSKIEPMDHYCVLFKKDVYTIDICKLRSIAEHVYATARDEVADLLNMYNYKTRVECLVGSRTINRREEVLMLTPNFYGIGLNLKSIIRKMFLWWQNKKHE
ncbi:MAG: hypothetical protein ABII64_07035 [Elusimicrobiota bacterium]